MSNWWLWFLTIAVLLATSAVLVVMDAGSRRNRQPGGLTDRLDAGCHGVGCICSLVMRHSDKVIGFVGNALVWTGALSLKRAIDTTVRLTTAKMPATCNC